jgi:hypothetical protein
MSKRLIWLVEARPKGFRQWWFETMMVGAGEIWHQVAVFDNQADADHYAVFGDYLPRYTWRVRSVVVDGGVE